MSEPSTSGRVGDARGTRKPDKRNRRGRRYDVKAMRRTLLPRIMTPQTGPEARDVTGYMLGLVQRFRLPVPVPDDMLETFVDAATARLTLGRLRRDLAIQEKLPEPSRAECRRLRSEIRRTTSQRRVAENVLATLAAEARAAERQRVPTVQDLLARVGRRG